MEEWYESSWQNCKAQRPRRRLWIVSTLFIVAIVAGAIVSRSIPTITDEIGMIDSTDSRNHRLLDNEIYSEKLYPHLIKIIQGIVEFALCPSPTTIKVPALPGKKGIAYTLRDEGQPGSWVENLPKVKKMRPYWNYSWGPKRIAQQPSHIEFIPMVWGGNNAQTLNEALTTLILPQIQNGTVTRVLGFNEPDSEAQSNMEVSVALERWKQLESLNVPLVSPSCAQPGRDWMTSFMKSVDATCKRVDWVGVHWYGTNFSAFKNAMIKYHDLYDRPILVTEFALADYTAKTVSENKLSKADTLQFMKDAVYWLETQSWIVGYAWFPFETTHPAGTNSALFQPNGSWTTLGKFYASVRTNRPRGDQSIV